MASLIGAATVGLYLTQRLYERLILFVFNIFSCANTSRTCLTSWFKLLELQDRMWLIAAVHANCRLLMVVYVVSSFFILIGFICQDTKCIILLIIDGYLVIDIHNSVFLHYFFPREHFRVLNCTG